MHTLRNYHFSSQLKNKQRTNELVDSIRGNGIKINKENLKKLIFELLMNGFRIKEEIIVELLSRLK